MVALRNSIPSLRMVAKKGSDEAESQSVRNLNKVGLRNAIHASDSTLCGMLTEFYRHIS
jgi:ABC-type polar amino acid transport system ATPase subunit